MPAADGTVTAEDVAAWIGIPVNDRISQSTAAALRWAEKRRSTTDPAELFLDDDVHLGTVLYATWHYQSRSTLTGMTGFDETGAAYPDSSGLLYRARELVGADPVTA